MNANAIDHILAGLKIEDATATAKVDSSSHEALGCAECNFNEFGIFHCFKFKGTWYKGHPRDVFASDLNKACKIEVSARDCKCKKELRLMKRIQLPDVPPKYRECSFQNFRLITNEQQASFNLARGYLLRKEYQQNRGVIFHGGPGKGKTHLAVSVYRELLKLEIRGFFITTSSALSLVKDSFKSQYAAEGPESLTAMCRTAKMIILDDIAPTPKDTDWSVSEVCTLVDYCYQQEKILIVTTNLKWPESVEQVFTRSTRDRLTEMCITIYCGGQSQRTLAFGQNISKPFDDQQAEVMVGKDDGLPF